MNVHYFKMHAQGNDFIIVTGENTLTLPESDLIKLSTDICDRHYGLGADGLVWLDSSQKIMRVYNADGTRPEMCGSALRCSCHLVHSITGDTEIAMMTDAGQLRGLIDKNNPEFVTIEVGTPSLAQSDVEVEGLIGDAVNVGNPHFVVKVLELDSVNLAMKAERIARCSFFAEGTNIEYYRIISPEEIDVYVWERGVGPTLACGTGAAAVVYSGRKAKHLADKVKVKFPGGSVFITVEDDMYWLGGDVAFVAEGVYRWRI